ncbi:MAG: hypothetical protein ABI085_19390 [Gemmatimonadaceae bacterium]
MRTDKLSEYISPPARAIGAPTITGASYPISHPVRRKYDDSSIAWRQRNELMKAKRAHAMV